MKKLYNFYWDCGRQGSINGLFVSEESEVQELIGKELYFGEVLGKHSEICGTLEANDISVKSEDQDFITKLVEVIGSESISGFDPRGYLNM